MWRGRVRYFSSSTRSSPKAAAASRFADAIAASSCAASSTTRMPLPPPPAEALINTGKPMRSGLALERFQVLRVAVIAGNQRHAGLLHQRLGGALGAHRPDRGCRRPDEYDPRRGASVGKVGVLRKEAVAGVNRPGAAALCRLDDARRVEVALPRRRGPDQVRLVAGRNMHRARRPLRSRRPPCGCPGAGRCAPRAPRSRLGWL